MTRIVTSLAFGLAMFAASPVFAAEKTVTLAVKNMSCATCPYTVKASLQRVAGVTNVVVSFKDKTAVVTYDDAKTGVTALTAATTNAGYPSAPKG